MSNRVRASCAAARLLHMATNGLNGGGGEVIRGGLQCRCTGLYYPIGPTILPEHYYGTELTGSFRPVNPWTSYSPCSGLLKLNGMLTIRLNSEGNQNKNGYKKR
jgi:hypothetical protein